MDNEKELHTPATSLLGRSFENNFASRGSESEVGSVKEFLGIREG